VADDDPIEVALPADAPLFGDLVDFATALAEGGETLRVIGGVAVTVWGIALRQPRGAATNDIDAVVPNAALTDAGSARTYARRLAAAAAAAGYARPSHPKPAERFAFLRPNDGAAEPRKIEVMTPDTDLGRLSRRPPPMRHLVDDDGLQLTAAVNPWLGLVPEPWTGVAATRQARRARFEIPSCPGLYLLKVRAIRDKQIRVAEEANAARRAHEIGRLARHLDDLVLIKGWIAGRDEFAALRRIADAAPHFRRETRDAEAWFLEVEPAVSAAVYARAPRAARGPAAVRDALDF
jgi:hypothetical protein